MIRRWTLYLEEGSLIESRTKERFTIIFIHQNSYLSTNDPNAVYLHIPPHFSQSNNTRIVSIFCCCCYMESFAFGEVVANFM